MIGMDCAALEWIDVLMMEMGCDSYGTICGVWCALKNHDNDAIFAGMTGFSKEGKEWFY